MANSYHHKYITAFIQRHSKTASNLSKICSMVIILAKYGGISASALLFCEVSPRFSSDFNLVKIALLFHSIVEFIIQRCNNISNSTSCTSSEGCYSEWHFRRDKGVRLSGRLFFCSLYRNLRFLSFIAHRTHPSFFSAPSSTSTSKPRRTKTLSLIRSPDLQLLLVGAGKGNLVEIFFIYKYGQIYKYVRNIKLRLQFIIIKLICEGLKL